MTPKYDRQASVNGIDLESANFFKVDQIRLDQPAEKEINIGTLANRDGDVVLGSKYGSKSVFLHGHFEAPQRWEYEKGRDILLSILDPERLVKLTVEQSGEMRVFEGVYKNITFDYKQNGFVMVSIEFQITGAFGVSVEPDIIFNNHTFTDELSEDFVVRGSIQALPVITLTINSINPMNEETKLTIVSKSGAKANRMTISRIFSQNDTIVIDSVNSRVTLNGSQIEYSGLLPEFRAHSSLAIYDTATSRNITINARYNGRWL